MKLEFDPQNIDEFNELLREHNLPYRLVPENYVVIYGTRSCPRGCCPATKLTQNFQCLQEARKFCEKHLTDEDNNGSYYAKIYFGDLKNPVI